MKNVKILPLVLLLPIIAACLFSCNDTLPEESAEITTEETTGGSTETYFSTDNLSPDDNFVAGDILISAKDIEADYTIEDFPEIDCARIALVSRTTYDSCWLIVLKTPTKTGTIEAIKKLAYRSDLNYAEPSYLYSAN